MDQKFKMKDENMINEVAHLTIVKHSKTSMALYP
jgi:hypothetical protein